MSLTSKSIIVTGGASGLGLAIATALSAAGASITICDISPESLASASSAHPSFRTVQADVTSDADISRVFDAAIAAHGAVDALVNNAGILDRFDPVGSVPRALWDKVLAVNLTAPMVASQLAVRHFLEKSVGEGEARGCIVNVTSAAVLRTASAGELGPEVGVA